MPAPTITTSTTTASEDPSLVAAAVAFEAAAAAAATTFVVVREAMAAQPNRTAETVREAMARATLPRRDCSPRRKKTVDLLLSPRLRLVIVVAEEEEEKVPRAEVVVPRAKKHRRPMPPTPRPPLRSEKTFARLVTTCATDTVCITWLNRRAPPCCEVMGGGDDLSN